MGRPGPPPTSKTTLKRRGSRKIANRPDELTAVGDVPKPPTYLTAEARAEWRRVVAAHSLHGTISAGDRAALTLLCQSWSDYWVQDKREKELLDNTASLHSSEVSMILRRTQCAKQDAFANWQNLAARFGLTPADRPRVKATTSTNTQDAKSNGKDRFISKPLELAG